MEGYPGGGSKKLHVLQRQVHAATHSIRNHLLSIDRDASIVRVLSEIYPKLPLIANLRNGLWYAPSWHSTCYFKSTDGHNNTWAFSTSRLNLDVVRTASTHNGCIIVDSTRRGKRFPDSLSATVPIWCQVINSIVLGEPPEAAVLPPWMSRSQCDQIRAKVRLIVDTISPEVEKLIRSTIGDTLKLPLRPVWAMHDADGSIEWIGDLSEDFVCNYTDNSNGDTNTISSNSSTTTAADTSPLSYIPLVLFSCSSDTTEAAQAEAHSWYYVKGAGDDEEHWCRSLTPGLFWRHRDELVGIEDNLLFEQAVDRIVASSRSQSIAHAADSLLASAAHACSGNISSSSSSSSNGGDSSSNNTITASNGAVAILDTGVHVCLSYTGSIDTEVHRYDGVIWLTHDDDEVVATDTTALGGCASSVVTDKASATISSSSSTNGVSSGASITDKGYCRIVVPNDGAKPHGTSNRWIDYVITASLKYYSSLVLTHSTTSTTTSTTSPPNVLIASQVDKAVAVTVALAVLTAFFGTSRINPGTSSIATSGVSADSTSTTSTSIGTDCSSGTRSSSRWVFERQLSRCISKDVIKVKLMTIQSLVPGLVLPRYVTKDITTYFLSPMKSTHSISSSSSSSSTSQPTVYGKTATLWDSICV